MTNQHPAPRRRVLPRWLRFQHDPTHPHWWYPHKPHRFDTWIAASALAVFVVGVILAAQC
jgi:hypothetical protein